MGLPAGERARSLTAAEAASGPWTEGRRDEVEEALPGGMGGAGIAAGSILSPEDVLPGTPAQPRPSAFSEAT